MNECFKALKAKIQDISPNGEGEAEPAWLSAMVCRSYLSSARVPLEKRTKIPGLMNRPP